MSFFLLDADTAIYALRDVLGVRDAVAEHDRSRVGMSSLVYSQLLQGAAVLPDAAEEHRRISVFVGSLVFASYDRVAADRYGEMIAAIGFSRRDIVDRMIAAHAISLNATLVTNNFKDFATIPKLRLVNWTTR